MNVEIFCVYMYACAYLIVEMPQFYNYVDLNCRLTMCASEFMRNLCDFDKCNL